VRAANVLAGDLENKLADAIYSGRVNVVRETINRGANVNERGANGKTISGFAKDQQAFSCFTDASCWVDYEKIINHEFRKIDQIPDAPHPVNR
jgi:hypothetical protein